MINRGCATIESVAESVGDAVWDAIVVGAGPAGAVAARQLAQSGLRTMLVERRAWPRSKVCGGCLNGRAIAILRELGLEDVLRRACAVSLDKLVLRARHRSAEIELPGGMAIRRLQFDAALVEAAVSAGARFLDETTAVVLPTAENADLRQVRLTGIRGENLVTEARLVVAADGLGHPSLRELPEFVSHAATGARVGLAFEIADLPASYRRGVISMAVSELGYVGVVRTAEGRGNLAAAVNATALKSATEPATVVRSILSDAGFSVPSFPESEAWRGTLPLTRRSSRLTGHRVVLIGDAAGYTEPFTGEGMGWALRSAVAIVPMVLRQLASWNGSAVAAWESDQQRLLWRDRIVSRTVSTLLRRPVAVQMALGLLSAVPSFARPLMRHVYH